MGGESSNSPAIKLRPHHIDTLRTILERGGGVWFDLLWSDSYKKMEELIVSLELDSVVEIVEGVDDICKVCEYLQYCTDKEYKKHPLALPLMNIFQAEFKPDKSDSETLSKYKIKIGDRYQLQELLKVNPFNKNDAPAGS
jgi:hypothetical protein